MRTTPRTHELGAGGPPGPPGGGRRRGRVAGAAAPPRLRPAGTPSASWTGSRRPGPGGNSDSELLIKSEPPERETREREPGKHRGNRIERRSDRVGNARPKGKARRTAREGEYEGSVRSLRTQQRAKNQRQIS